MKKSFFKAVYIPSICATDGIGHVMRAYAFAKSGNEQLQTSIYITADNMQYLTRLPQVIQKDILKYCISDIKSIYDIVFVDMRDVSLEQFSVFSKFGCCIGIDIGGEARPYFHYLIDTLPNLLSKKSNKSPNVSNYNFCCDNIKNISSFSLDCGLPKKILLYATDKNLNVYEPFFTACEQLNISLTHITTNIHKIHKNVQSIPPQENIIEYLKKTDLLITHYGILAFQALKLGIPTILVNPTKYHNALSKHAQWNAHFSTYKEAAKYIKKLCSNKTNFHTFLQTQQQLQHKMYRQKDENAGISFNSFLYQIAKDNIKTYDNKFIANPYVQNTRSSKFISKAVFRNKDKSVFMCPQTHLLYQIPFTKPVSYNEDYFFSEYKQQYGKTYIEDLPHIKKKMENRLDVIEQVSPVYGQNKSLLDIGCAYGAMVELASEKNIHACGVDVSSQACRYIKKTLGLLAYEGNIFQSNFIQNNMGNISFDIITCFFVLEHSPYFRVAITNSVQLLKKGGILALAVPNANGISMRKDANLFFEQNPIDHFSMFTPQKLSKYLQQYNLKIKKIKITGHHPSRFISHKKNQVKKQSNISKMFYQKISELTKAGDTFELYLEKV